MIHSVAPLTQEEFFATAAEALAGAEGLEMVEPDSACQLIITADQQCLFYNALTGATSSFSLIRAA